MPCQPKPVQQLVLGWIIGFIKIARTPAKTLKVKEENVYSKKESAFGSIETTAARDVAARIDDTTKNKFSREQQQRSQSENI